MMTNFRKAMMAMMLITLTTTLSAQRYQSLYSVRGNKAMFDGKVIPQADASSFEILGYGYAKDRSNVYLDGQLLRFVDPRSFRLIGDAGHPQQGEVNVGRGHDHISSSETVNGRGHDHDYYYDNGRPYHAEYLVTNSGVYFDGRYVKGANSSSFKDLGYGYGRDAFDVYYFGNKLQKASVGSFKVLTDGYAKDAFSAYYRGQLIADASGSSFKILGEGYTKDAFNVFYMGQKVKGAHGSSFKVDTNGYAHDAFEVYYYGVKVQR